MNIISVVLKHSNKKHWIDALVWLLWSIVCGLIPLWVTILILYLIGSTTSYYVLLDDGEFMLYSAAYLGGAFYIVLRDFKNVSFPSKDLIALSMVALLITSTLTYSLITVDVVPESSSTLIFFDLFIDNAITRISLVVLPITMIFTFIIMVAENIRQRIDISHVLSQKFDEFEKKFDHLEGE